MKKFIVAAIFGIAATALWAADQVGPGEELRGAIKQLVAKDNYRWSRTSKPPGQTEGSISNDGRMYVVTSLPGAATTRESAMSGGKLARKLRNEWRPTPALGGREIGGVLRNREDPAVEADDLASKTRELKRRDQGVYFGDLTEEGAKSLVAFGAPDGERALRLAGAKGTATFWVKEGTLVKFEYHVEGRVAFTAGEREVNVTTTTVVKDIGTTKVEIPKEAEKILRSR